MVKRVADLIPLIAKERSLAVVDHTYGRDFLPLHHKFPAQVPLFQCLRPIRRVLLDIVGDIRKSGRLAPPHAEYLGKLFARLLPFVIPVGKVFVLSHLGRETPEKCLQRLPIGIPGIDRIRPLHLVVQLTLQNMRDIRPLFDLDLLRFDGCRKHAPVTRRGRREQFLRRHQRGELRRAEARPAAVLPKHFRVVQNKDLLADLRNPVAELLAVQKAVKIELRAIVGAKLQVQHGSLQMPSEVHLGLNAALQSLCDQHIVLIAAPRKCEQSAARHLHAEHKVARETVLKDRAESLERCGFLPQRFRLHADKAFPRHGRHAVQQHRRADRRHCDRHSGKESRPQTARFPLYGLAGRFLSRRCALFGTRHSILSGSCRHRFSTSLCRRCG